MLKTILEEYGHCVKTYDPYLDTKVPDLNNAICFISTKHECFKEFDFPSSSIVIDPWRYLDENKIDNLIRIGINEG